MRVPVRTGAGLCACPCVGAVSHGAGDTRASSSTATNKLCLPATALVPPAPGTAHVPRAGAGTRACVHALSHPAWDTFGSVSLQSQPQEFAAAGTAEHPPVRQCRSLPPCRPSVCPGYMGIAQPTRLLSLVPPAVSMASLALSPAVFPRGCSRPYFTPTAVSRRCTLGLSSGKWKGCLAQEDARFPGTAGAGTSPSPGPAGALALPPRLPCHSPAKSSLCAWPGGGGEPRQEGL